MPIGKPENPESTFMYMLCISLSTNARYLRSGKASNGSRFELFGICSFVLLPFLFVLFLYLCSYWSIVDVVLIYSCSAHHVPDWQPRMLLGLVNARPVGAKNTCDVEFQWLSASR